MSASHTLLIVDDCPEDREIYRDYLSCDPQYSYQFIEASLAEAGLDLFNQHHCDAILLDFYMPDMNGLEFVEALQVNQSKEHPPIILLTGQGNESLAVRAMKQGIQDYLGKQYLQPEALQLAVRNVIQQAQLNSLLSKTRDRQRLVAMTALRIRQSLELDQVLNTVVAEIQQVLECDYVVVHQVLSSQETKIRAELGKRCTVFSPADSAAAREIICPNNHDFSALFLQNTNESLVAPIARSFQRPKDDPWGYLVAHKCGKQFPWHSEETLILQELAVQLAIAIQQSELLSQTQTALEKEKELNHFKSQVIATVSHEYRTPLTAILSAASTLAHHGEVLEASKKKRVIEIIQHKARHMTKLIDDMLVMHQCELEQTKFQPMPMNLLQFLADTVEEYRDMVDEKHTLSFNILGRTHGFWGDQGMLRLVFDNILSNSIKYSPKGGNIEVSLVGEKDSVQVSIRDEGIGIPLSDQQNVFKSFSRAKNVETISGTGLGLAIAHAFVTLHNGIITLESAENKGTKIIVQLPKQPPTVQNTYRVDL